MLQRCPRTLAPIAARRCLHCLAVAIRRDCEDLLNGFGLLPWRHVGIAFRFRVDGPASVEPEANSARTMRSFGLVLVNWLARGLEPRRMRPFSSACRRGRLERDQSMVARLFRSEGSACRAIGSEDEQSHWAFGACAGRSHASSEACGGNRPVRMSDISSLLGASSTKAGGSEPATPFMRSLVLGCIEPAWDDLVPGVVSVQLAGSWRPSNRA